MREVHRQPPACYFSYVPAAYDHYSTETPLAHPEASVFDATPDSHHPLLAIRRNPPLTPCLSMDASKLMGLQTAAAHQLNRPKPQPQQNLLTTSDDSVRSSSSSDSGSSSASTPQLIFCSRCQRSSYGTAGMVCFAMNSYYCTRCASLVGYGG